MTRRSFVPAAAGVVGVSALAADAPIKRKLRIKQGATRGCFPKGMSVEEMCQVCVRLGMVGLDLSGPADWPTLKKYGLISVMSGGGGAPRPAGAPSQPPAPPPPRGGAERKENHDRLEKQTIASIMNAAEAGMPNLMVGLPRQQEQPDAEIIENVSIFLKRVKNVAEDKGVTLNMELLNTKVNHPGAFPNYTWKLVEICKQVDSPRVKILYDIYHMQIMEGDIIRTIRDNIKYIGHFHTAGNPGRHEIDDTQELNYRAICLAIVDTGYKGYLGHEYTPLGDPIKALDQAVTICDV